MNEFISEIYKIMGVLNDPQKEDSFYLSVEKDIDRLPVSFYSDFLLYLRNDKFVKKYYCNKNGNFDREYLDTAVVNFIHKQKKEILKSEENQILQNSLIEAIYSISLNIPDKKISNVVPWMEGKKLNKFLKIEPDGYKSQLFSPEDLSFLNSGKICMYLEEMISNSSNISPALEKDYSDFLFLKSIDKALYI